MEDMEYALMKEKELFQIEKKFFLGTKEQILFAARFTNYHERYVIVIDFSRDVAMKNMRVIESFQNFLLY